MGWDTGKHQKHINIAAGQASGVIYNGSGVITAISLRETTGAATAAIELYDGSNNTGYSIFELELASGASNTQSFGSFGLEFNGGLYYNAVSGSVKGGVTWVLADDWDEYRSIPLVINVPIDEAAAFLAAGGMG